MLIPDELPAGVLLSPCDGVVTRLEGKTMGTFWSTSLVLPGDVSLQSAELALESAFARVIREMSHWDAGSDLTRFNRARGGTWHALPPGFFKVLSRTCQIADASSGACDPTLGEVTDLRGHGPRLLETGDDLTAALDRAGWRKIRLDRRGRRAFQPGGLRLDLSAIAKGHAVDLAAGFLNEAGIRNFLIEIGGELRGQGCKPDGSPWWVSLARCSDESPETVIALCGMSVATSGNEFRDHLVDPRDGSVAGKNLVSVTVLARECMEADAWATALFVVGHQEGLRLAEQQRLAAMFTVQEDGMFREEWSSAFARMLD
ncbi:MAG: FAD:protein FMN transferase [Verrucomicrobiota bacterium]